ncbi:hypothetical protein U1Q18_005818 [Sarracenia purpurea var. burkii]
MKSESDLGYGERNSGGFLGIRILDLNRHLKEKTNGGEKIGLSISGRNGISPNALRFQRCLLEMMYKKRGRELRELRQCAAWWRYVGGGWLVAISGGESCRRGGDRRTISTRKLPYSGGGWGECWRQRRSANSFAFLLFVY